jgi:hypothetical protein
MSAKTLEVKTLVQDVLCTIPYPYPESIIFDVFKKIKANPDFEKRYHDLVADLSVQTVNPWIGRYTRTMTGLKPLGKSATPHGPFITSYTRLGN